MAEHDPFHEHDIPEAVIEALWQGQRIEAIRQLRRAEGLGLKHAKLRIDRYVASNPALAEKNPKDAGPGCALVIALLLVAIGFALGWWFA